MGQGFFASGLIRQRTELHVHVGQLRKSVVIAAQGAVAQGKETFFPLGKDMGLHAADFVELDPPIGQLRIGHELREFFIVDRLKFGNDERRGLAYLGKQILHFADAREVLRVGVVFGELQPGEVIKAFDFHLERLLELEASGEALRRFTHAALPLFQPRKCLLHPAETLLPLADIREEKRQVPFV